MPSALNRPATGGTTIHCIPDESATVAAWTGPLPPMAKSVNCDGSMPFSDETPLGLAARAAARAGTSSEVEIDGRTWFLEVHNPALELILIGAVHIAQPLAQMARLTGYAVRVIDPRTAFATEARFPGVILHQAWPDEVLAGLTLGSRSAVVVLAHDPKIDDPALEAALASPAFYIGALGSKKTHAARLGAQARRRDVHRFQEVAGVTRHHQLLSFRLSVCRSRS